MSESTTQPLALVAGFIFAAFFTASGYLSGHWGDYIVAAASLALFAYHWRNPSPPKATVGLGFALIGLMFFLWGVQEGSVQRLGAGAAGIALGGVMSWMGHRADNAAAPEPGDGS